MYTSNGVNLGKMIESIQQVTEFFAMMDPAVPLNLLQLQRVWACKLLRFFGYRDLLTVCDDFNRILEKQINEKSADPNGDLIEKGWAEIEKNRDNPGATFHGDDGYKHLVGQMQDVFIAG